jgi:ribonuclease HII
MNALQAYDRDRLAQAAFLIGVDEAGRGCLAGPVVAAACVVSVGLFDSDTALKICGQVNDSKQLTGENREAQFAILENLQADGLVDFAVSEGSVEEIGELNILGATRLAMRRALETIANRASDWKLPSVYEDPLFEVGTATPSRPQQADGRMLEGKPPCHVSILVDGRPLKPFPYAHEGVVKGDGKSLSIAIASIAAKVVRDRRMCELDAQYPEYGFAQHKGYGTQQHRNALKTYGATTMHRELFLRRVLELS